MGYLFPNIEQLSNLGKKMLQSPIMLTIILPVATIFIIVHKWHNFCLRTAFRIQTRMIQNYGFIPNQIFNVQNEQQNALTSLLQSSEPHSSLSLSSYLIHWQGRSLLCLYMPISSTLRLTWLHQLILGVHAERAIGVPRIGIS